MKLIIRAQSKVPTDIYIYFFCFLETAVITFRYILASRRANYFHNILKGESNDPVKCVYFAQKDNPSKGG